MAENMVFLLWLATHCHGLIVSKNSQDLLSKPQRYGDLRILGPVQKYARIVVLQVKHREKTRLLCDKFGILVVYE